MTVLRSVFIVCLLLSAMLLASGCSHTRAKPYAFDFDYSVNVARVYPDWPTPEEEIELPDSQKACLREYGPPEFMYLNWSGSEEVVDSSHIYHIMREADPPESALPEADWIYLSREKIVSFPNHFRYVESPLSDVLQLICEVGDPQKRKIHQNRRDEIVQEWTYFRLGRIYTFVDGALIERDDTTIPPMPLYRYRD